jgi:hypothetical protein
LTEPALKTVLFDVAAHFEPARGWIVPLHAWVFRPTTSRLWKRAATHLFERRHGLVVTPDVKPLFDRRVDLLLADDARGKAPVVEVAGLRRHLQVTAPNGHSRTELVLPASVVPPSGGVVTVMGDHGARGRVHCIPDAGTTVISDLDDTVKATGVLDRTSLWRSTFFEPFVAVPGMAPLIRQLAGPGGAVHYVSSTPWHLYEPVREWLDAEGFPASALHLKSIRFKDRTIFDLLKRPDKLKTPVVLAIVGRWSRHRFVFVGDSGERDPEVYGVVARLYPDRVDRILIRRAPGDESPLSRFEEAFDGLPREMWQVFDDPAEVAR